MPLATDKFLLLTAEADEVNDFSTADEVKDLSTLWSMSRWKKKTQRKKLIAQHHRKIVVSSDSDSDEEEGLDEAQKVVTGAPTSSAQTGRWREPAIYLVSGRLSGPCVWQGQCPAAYGPKRSCTAVRCACSRYGHSTAG